MFATRGCINESDLKHPYIEFKTPTSPPSLEQFRILCLLDEYHKRSQGWPTVRELAKIIKNIEFSDGNLKKSTSVVSYNINKLAENNHIVKRDNKAANYAIPPNAVSTAICMMGEENEAAIIKILGDVTVELDKIFPPLYQTPS